MTIDPGPVAQNPFMVITIIAAPAILTNAASILSLSTSTRLMRCLDRINQLTMKLDQADLSGDLKSTFAKQIELSHRQSRLFLMALRGSYTTLASFATASFAALIGATTAAVAPALVTESLAALGIFTGGIGACGFILSSFNLVKASKITIVIINTDMDHLKRHHALLP